MQENELNASLLASDPKVREFFDKAVGEQNTSMDREAWKRYMKHNTTLELQDKEAERLWATLVSRVRSASSPRGKKPEEQTLTFEEFVNGLPDLAFLRQIVSFNSSSVAFKVPETYNWDLSTKENYRCKEGVACRGDNSCADSFSKGKYADFRKNLDTGYHGHYSESRQKWQDDIITSTAVRGDPVPNPFLVFTCGPAGVGKGTTLSWMSRNGYFPLEHIVHVDPDHFKSLMPEWSEYKKRSTATAARLCHPESALMAELAQHAAMEARQNVWIDSTLKEVEWWEKQLKAIRERFPHYRLAILVVSAPEDVVRERVQSRARATGRSVPEDVLRESLAAVENSVNRLKPLVHFVAVINNGRDEGIPELDAFEHVDRSGSWNTLKQHFDVAEPSAFPHSLAPLIMYPVANCKALKLKSGNSVSDYDSKLLIEAELVTEELQGGEAIKDVLALMSSASMSLSPSTEVNLPGEAMEKAGIPKEAVTFVFCHPSENMDWAKIENLDYDKIENSSNASPDDLAILNLLQVGAFVYFDKDENVCQINALGNLGLDAQARKKALGSNNFLMVQFGPPHPLVKTHVKKLIELDRFHPITLAMLFARKAQYFAWIKPGEVPNAPYGAFAYVFGDDNNQPLPTEQDLYFPITS